MSVHMGNVGKYPFSEAAKSTSVFSAAGANNRPSGNIG